MLTILSRRARLSLGCRRALLLAGFLMAPAAATDVLLLKKGEKVTGRILSEDAAEIVINVYHSRFAEANRGLERVPVAQVARRLRLLEPHHELAEKLAAVPPEDVSGLLDVARWAKKAKLPKPLLEEIVCRALVAAPQRDAAVEEVEDLLGAARTKELLRADARLCPALGALQQEYLATTDYASRKALHGRIAKEHDIAELHAYYERAWRSRRLATGYHEDLPLTYRSSEIKGVYTLWVPPDYDPFRPYPLMIGLHGGGAGGAAGDEVVGDGPSAMPFYRREAEQRGYILVCPTAVEAGWGGRNDLLLDALLAELRLSYNIDDNRVFLVGHSMGGGGCWVQGPRLAAQLAGLAPLSAYRSQGFHELVAHRTAVYCYHGADDNVCPVGAGRNAATQLKKVTADFIDEGFVYTEVADSGHGLPDHVVTEMFDFFADRVRWEGEGKKARPSAGARSSFLAKVTPLEVEYFGRFEDMAAEAGAAAGERSTPELLEVLLQGGGNGAAAAPELGRRAAADAKLLANLGRAATNPKGDEAFNPDVRALAALALGHSAAAAARPYLEKALADDFDEVRSAAASALGRIGDKAASPQLVSALQRQADLLKGKVQGGRLDYTDLEVTLRADAALLEGLRGAGDGTADTAAAVARTVIDGALLDATPVDYTARAGQDPERLRAGFTRDHLLPTLHLLDVSTIRPTLESLRDRFARAGGIAEEIESLLASAGK